MLDLIGTLLVMLGALLISSKIKICAGFAFGVLGSALLFLYFYISNQYILASLQVYFVTLNIYGWWRWKC